jgi:hypothetical protein
MRSAGAILVLCLLSTSCDVLLGIEDTNAVARGVHGGPETDAAADAAPAMDGSRGGADAPDHDAAE